MLFLSAPVYIYIYINYIYIYIHMRKHDTRDMIEMYNSYKQSIFIIYIMFLISCSLIGWHKYMQQNYKDYN